MSEERKCVQVANRFEFPMLGPCAGESEHGEPSDNCRQTPEECEHHDYLPAPDAEPEPLCAVCGLTEIANGGDVHCTGDCDDASHGERGGCHDFVHPQPATSEPDEQIIARFFNISARNNELEAWHRYRDRIAALEAERAELAAKLATAIKGLEWIAADPLSCDAAAAWLARIREQP